MTLATEMQFDPAVEQRDSTIAKDLRLNLKRIIHDGALTPEEAHLALLATASSVEYPRMKKHAEVALAELGLSDDQIREAAESSAMMAMLNTYYRFRHMVDKNEDYRTAGLRMTSLARPSLGKEHFEMLAFAVSVVNGCQSCIASHEQVLRDVGISTDKIHDLARLASVVKALKTLSTC